VGKEEFRLRGQVEKYVPYSAIGPQFPPRKWEIIVLVLQVVTTLRSLKAVFRTVGIGSSNTAPA
jgi:hypothetical protein